VTALAQGSAGLALVMGFALLRTLPFSAAAILLLVQSGAVAVTAVVVERPLMAVPPLLLGGGLWLIRHEMKLQDPGTAPIGGIAVGALLAILCQSQGSLALPLSIILLSVLLVATRSHRVMQLVALVGAQNGVALAGCLLPQPADPTASLLVPLACLFLPLPLAAGLFLPTMAPALDHSRIRTWLTGARHGGRHGGRWLGWVDLVIAIAMFAATLLVPLHALAAIFAPLLGLDGVLRAWVRRRRSALTPMRRGAALAQSGFSILAVCTPDLLNAWLALLGAIAMEVLPTLSRRWGSAILAFLAALLALFGVLMLQAAASILGYFSLFAGIAGIAAVIPELAVVLVILILGLANQGTWPHEVAATGAGIAVAALLACAILLTVSARPHRATMLVLGQASIAAVSICIGQEAGRFAALVLLILLILTRSAARVTDGRAATLALAGLGGIPPLGVFPGLVLVVLALAAHDPWLLLPVGLALIPFAAASLPPLLPDFALRPNFARGRGAPSIAWLPLAASVLAGYFAPDQLVHWWHLLTAGGP
jgi:hypothetical protein